MKSEYVLIKGDGEIRLDLPKDWTKRIAIYKKSNKYYHLIKALSNHVFSSRLEWFLVDEGELYIKRAITKEEAEKLMFLEGI